MELIIESVWQNKRTSVRACHGISKTYVAALISVTFLNTFRNSVVVTSAPTFRQVEKLLWKEIGAIYRDYGRVLLGRPLQTEIKIAPDWYMFGFATDRPVNVEGLHAPAILWVIDEAKGMPEEFYKSLEGSMTGGFSRALEISTTDGADQGTPFRRHQVERGAEWKSFRLSALDSPFVDPSEERWKPYRQYLNKDLFLYGRPKSGTEWPLELRSEIQIADAEWIEDRIKAWAEVEPDTLLTKVWGEFAEKTEHDVIPVAWVEAAVNNPRVKANPKRTVFGLDVAEYGNDHDVLTERQGGFVFEQKMWSKMELMELVGNTIRHAGKRGPIHVDVIGVGAGVWSRLVEQKYMALRIESAAKPFHNPDECANLRAEMWWHARAVFLRNFKEGNILSIPDDADLKADLTSMRYKTRSDGRILMEEKKEFKKRVGRSPDKGDSLIYCLADIPIPPPEELSKELADLLMV